MQINEKRYEVIKKSFISFDNEKFKKEFASSTKDTAGNIATLVVSVVMGTIIEETLTAKVSVDVTRAWIKSLSIKEKEVLVEVAKKGEMELLFEEIDKELRNMTMMERKMSSPKVGGFWDTHLKKVENIKYR
jgi:hypothetical protein